jgi:alpha-tubulin suppressor-like RCC1 family protein
VRIGTANNWASVSAGDQHTVALTTNGELWAWGRNSEGQLGSGAITPWDHPNPVPMRVGMASNWAYVSAGSAHTVAVTTNGELWAWGQKRIDAFGQIIVNYGNAPRRIGTATNWSSVSAGGEYTVAITTNGELWAWGLGGQLGDGTTGNRISPVRIGTASNWVSASAGLWHTAALRDYQELWAWGRNSEGQLGNGTTSFTNLVPVRIGTWYDWVSLSAGREHTVGLRPNGELWAWGQNSNGQLGNGTTERCLSPVRTF